VSDAGARVEARAQDAVVVIKDARDAVGQQAADASVALNDAAITASIKADFLKDDGLDVLKIEVDSRDGVVSLNGLAGSDASRLRAGRIAAAIKGVHEVRNFLVVKQA
jgi:hyperosmotically inducible protein